MKKLFFLFSLLFIFVYNVNAQKKSGEIQYEIKMDKGKANLSNNSESPINSFFNDSSSIVNLLFNNQFVKITTQSQFFNVGAIANAKTNKFTILLDFLGQKMAFELDNNDLKLSDEQMTNSTDKYQQLNDIIFQESAKKVQGFMCNKYQTSDEEENDILMFTTTKIKLPEFNFPLKEMFTQANLKGVPLLIEMQNNSTKGNFKAEAIKIKKRKVKNKEFEIPEGYQIMDDNFLKNMNLSN